MGFIIKEGDDIAEVVIHAEHKKALETELEKYVALAFEVSKESNTKYHLSLKIPPSQLSNSNLV